MMLTKKDIRKSYLAKRLALTEEEAAALNDRLVQQCHGLDMENMHTVHLFLPILAKKEIDTYPLVEWLRTTFPGIRLVLSRSFIATGDMEHYLWDEQTRLVHNSLGIPEPEEGVIIPPQEIDMVFVPMLAFDMQGHRIGYGKGMYDVFLRQCREDVRKVGLSMFPPLPVIEDVYEGDVQLDAVVTPSQIYYFKS